MADDWQWFWAGEQGRDRILRDELEGLQAQSVAARERSSRLNSQLANLSGSIETRLSALSAAFDAYVELGDVREQLSGYPDTAAIRRDTANAIDQLSRGGVVSAVDTRELDYWLPYATNAVIALADGTANSAAERRAVELDRDAELFIVAAAGALGHGDVVASRVAPLLVCDGTLTPHQVALWTAAYAGVYGAILPEVRSVWAGSLKDSCPCADWQAWVRASSMAGDAEGALRWLDAQTASATSAESAPQDSVPVEPAANNSDPTVLLRQVVGELVGRGMPGEAELLARSRNLRARIEDPRPGDQPPSGKRDAAGPSPTTQSQTTVVPQVRAALLATGVGSAARAELLSWISGALVTAVDPLLLEAKTGEPAGMSVKTPGGSVPVTVQGPLAVALTRATENIALRHSTSAAKLYGSVAIAAGFALLALVSAIFVDSSGLAIVLTLSALAAAVVAFSTLRQRSAGAAQKGAELKELDRNVSEGIAAAQQRERDRQQRHADLVALTDTLRMRLGSGQTGRVASGASGVGSTAGSVLPA